MCFILNVVKEDTKYVICVYSFILKYLIFVYKNIFTLLNTPGVSFNPYQ